MGKPYFQKHRDQTPTSAVVITPSATATHNPPFDAIYCNSSGNIALIASDDHDAGVTTPIVFAVTAGQILPVSVSRVLVAGTTATNLIGLRNDKP